MKWIHKFFCSWWIIILFGVSSVNVLLDAEWCGDVAVGGGFIGCSFIIIFTKNHGVNSKSLMFIKRVSLL